MTTATATKPTRQELFAKGGTEAQEQARLTYLTQQKLIAEKLGELIHSAFGNYLGVYKLEDSQSKWHDLESAANDFRKIIMQRIDSVLDMTVLCESLTGYDLNNVTLSFDQFQVMGKDIPQNIRRGLISASSKRATKAFVKATKDLTTKQILG